MGLFSVKYIYADVFFRDGKHAYTYRTRDRSIKVNDIVMVPAGDELKPAIVSRVRVYEKENVPVPPESIKEIVKRASFKHRLLFQGVDMRVPYDISVKKVKTARGYATVITDKDERKRLRERYKNRSDIKIVETQPVSKAHKIISRDDSRLFNRTGRWEEQEYLNGRITYRCSRCGSVFSKREAFCPKCHSENKRVKYDPVWVDEAAVFDE